MKFCTTCGRTYEDPAVTVCPHDGTPLFGMAGDEDGAGGDEAVESADAVEIHTVEAFGATAIKDNVTEDHVPRFARSGRKPLEQSQSN